MQINLIFYEQYCNIFFKTIYMFNNYSCYYEIME